MISTWKSERFDGIGFTSGENFTHSFPDHFHYEYTVGVSTSGIQKFDLQGKSFMVEPFSVFLIKPEQMHAHYPIAELGWSFKSIYLSLDFVNYLLKGSGTQHINSINSPILNDEALFNAYINLHQNKEAPSETEFATFLKALFRKSAIENDALQLQIPERIAEIKCYLLQQLNQKLSLDKISKKFSIDKYQLIRQFKTHTGVTPNTYLTILRIEKARKLISNHFPIIEAALEAGFYDQSHFHHNFVHYTGLTPGAY